MVTKIKGVLAFGNFDYIAVLLAEYSGGELSAGPLTTSPEVLNTEL